MSESVNASIRFGGKLNYDKVDELLDLINEKHLGPDWDMVGEVTREHLDETNFFGSSEVNYGNLDELTSFCEENGLSYEYECGAGSEWDGSKTFYNAETGETREFVGEQDEAITLKKIKELGSYEAVLAYFDMTLPPFEIVGELPLGEPLVEPVGPAPIPPPVEDVEQAECMNCGWNGGVDELGEIKGFHERVQPGDTAVPAGECPECGCLAYLKEDDFADEEKADMKHNATMLDGCETDDELNAELRAQTQGN